MLRTGDKKVFVLNDLYLIVCECIGVDRNGNTIIKTDVFKESLYKKGCYDYVKTTRDRAYTFEDVIERHFRGLGI